MPEDKWNALKRGENCPLCAKVASDELVDPYGHTVGWLSVSLLRLVPNQYVKGYCVLIYREHVVEPYDLGVAERNAYFDDVLRAGKALESVFGATKLNFEILGNAVPHLHTHLKPRYYGDAAPSRPIDPDEGSVLLSPEEMETRVAAIQQALNL
jgi:diadenosine tetraphosphate (Ap4A) HIT family hydrolase